MTDIRKHISTLTMPEKVELFNDLYGELSGYGTEGDTELAHVNTFEVGLLKSVGGSGTINEITGLVQFGGGGTPPPAQTTVNQQASFPKELRPFVEDVLTQGQAEYERQATEGYQRFGGPQLADFSPEQLAAQDLGRQQFTGLAGTALADPRTYYQPALAATALGTAEIGTEDIQRRMDPFLQNVVDVAKRETRRDEELAQQGRGAQAVGAGSFGGSRHAIVEAEAERNLGQRLGDIQSRGLSAAFQNAQQAAEAQRAREMAGGRQFAALGDITGARARSDLAGLTGIGEVGQQREQQALDIAQREFREEKAFPQTNLQQYSALIRGFPLQASQQRFAQETLPTPSLAQTLAGGVGTAASLYGAFGGFGGNKEGGLVGLQGGGQPMMGPQMQQQPNAMMQQQPNEMDTLEMLRQRGAAIRGLSEPTNRSSGGIVNKSIGSILRQTKGGAKSMDLAGDFGSAVRDKDSKGLLRMMLRNNPKLLKKLGVGAGSSGRKTSYAEFNPGTAGSQYAEGGLVELASGQRVGHAGRQEDYASTLSPLPWQQRGWTAREMERGERGPRSSGKAITGNRQSFLPFQMAGDLLSLPEGEDLEIPPEIQAKIEQRKRETGNESTPSPSETPDQTSIINQWLQKQMDAFDIASKGLKSAYEGYDKVSEADKKYLAALEKTDEYLQGREGKLDEQRQRAQWGNLAQFFSRLGTDVSGGAQQGGIRGLLGAAVSAGGESVPEILATEQEFTERSEDLQDKIFDSNLKYLSASRDISKEEFEAGTQKAIAAFEMSKAGVELGISIAEADADAKAALNLIDSADSAQLTSLVNDYATVALSDDGVFMLGNQVLQADKKLQLNDINKIGAIALYESGGNWKVVRQVVQPLVEQMLNGTYVMSKQQIPAVTPAEDPDGADATEQGRENLATGDSGSLVDQVGVGE